MVCMKRRFIMVEKLEDIKLSNLVFEDSKGSNAISAIKTAINEGNQTKTFCSKIELFGYPTIVLKRKDVYDNDTNIL